MAVFRRGVPAVGNAGPEHAPHHEPQRRVRPSQERCGHGGLPGGRRPDPERLGRGTGRAADGPSRRVRGAALCRGGLSPVPGHTGLARRRCAPGCGRRHAWSKQERRKAVPRRVRYQCQQSEAAPVRRRLPAPVRPPGRTPGAAVRDPGADFRSGRDALVPDLRCSRGIAGAALAEAVAQAGVQPDHGDDLRRLWRTSTSKVKAAEISSEPAQPRRLEKKKNIAPERDCRPRCSAACCHDRL